MLSALVIILFLFIAAAGESMVGNVDLEDMQGW